MLVQKPLMRFTTNFMVAANTTEPHQLKHLAVQMKLDAQKIIIKLIVAKMESAPKKAMMVKTAARKMAVWTAAKMANAACPVMMVKTAARNLIDNFQLV